MKELSIFGQVWVHLHKDVFRAYIVILLWQLPPSKTIANLQCFIKFDQVYQLHFHRAMV